MPEAYKGQAFRQEPFLYDPSRRVRLEHFKSGMKLKTEGEMFRLGNMFGKDVHALETERIREVYFRTADGDIYWLTGYDSTKGKLVSANKSKKNNHLAITQLSGEELGKTSLVIGQRFPSIHTIYKITDMITYEITEIVAVRFRDPIDNNNVGRKDNIERDFRKRLPRQFKNTTINDLQSL